VDEILIGIRAVHIAATAVAAGTLIVFVFVAAPAFGASPTSEANAQALSWRLSRIVWLALAAALLSGPRGSWRLRPTLAISR
jgi:hypothetical protein